MVGNRTCAKGRTLFAGLVALVAIAAAAAPVERDAHAAPAADGRPNIITIVTDDQSEQLFKRRLMPNTFRLLEAGGTRLTNFSITTPLCCPSRATQLTGQYGHNTGVLANDPGYPDLLEPANVLPSWLRNADYRTAHVGKFLNGYWRAGAPAEPAPGWDRWIGLMNLHYWDYDLSVDGRQRHIGGDDPRWYVTRLLHRWANRLIRDLAAEPEPFYLQFDELAPHDDHAAEASCLRTALPGPHKLRRVLWVKLRQRALEANVSDKPRFIRKLPALTPAARTAIQRRLRCRAGAVREIDKGVGRIIRLLKRTGELDETVFIFYSDNGYFSGEHRLFKGKGLPYEEAVRVPAMIRVPAAYLGGVAAPHELESATANIDLAPTILDLAGADPCTDQGRCRMPDGRSLLPVLEDPDAWPRDRAILLEMHQPGRVAGATLGCTWAGIKRGEHVYVEYERVIMPGAKRCTHTEEAEHYRLEGDPGERHNLWPPRTDRERNTQRDLAAQLEGLRRCSGSVVAAPEPPNPCP